MAASTVNNLVSIFDAFALKDLRKTFLKIND